MLADGSYREVFVCLCVFVCVGGACLFCQCNKYKYRLGLLGSFVYCVTELLQESNSTVHAQVFDKLRSFNLMIALDLKSGDYQSYSNFSLREARSRVTNNHMDIF